MHTLLRFLSLVVLAGAIASVAPGHATVRGSGSHTIYLPLTLKDYPCYSVGVVPTALGTEYRFYCQEHHFMTLVNENGSVNFRPHPGRDVNGWGSSWYAQPFIAGATPGASLIESVLATPDGIQVEASGQVNHGASSYGEWRISLRFAYDSAAKQVSGTGTYQISLAGPLAGAGGDLNIYKIASNYLIHVPQLGGGVGDTGDMHSATVTRNGNDSFIWVPPLDHCPQDPAQSLGIHVSGQYNQVDTAAMGYAPIQPAYKPSLKVVLTNVPPTTAPMIPCAFYAEGSSQTFWHDNVGLNAVVRQTTTATMFTYQVDFESLALPSECSLPSTCV
jgi:hypothetical protein